MVPFPRLFPMTFKDILKRMTLGDKLLMIFLTVATGAAFPWLSAQSAKGEWGVIDVDGRFIRKVPLYKENKYTIKGYLYQVLIEVKEEGIEIRDNSCPNPLLHSGRISRTGEFRVCVHNRTVIRIEGKDSRGIDVLSK